MKVLSTLLLKLTQVCMYEKEALFLMGLVRKYNVVKWVPRSPLTAELRQKKKRRKKIDREEDEKGKQWNKGWGFCSVGAVGQ